uniref:30S ribosomal protein S24e n=1 Tax=uncultured marine thaumarchaeote SAT1000_05_G10 TaxID=1456358 RepID=A0A075I6U6_9ARCH|nr:hypothetical protein [uncultured marine thaumarchaeote SAT1000_05_G10]
MIETLSDKNNSFLSRREIICDFKGLGGKLEKMQAIEMITKEFKLEKKLVIPMMLKNHTGMPKITGTFYVYDDEKLAKEHIDPTIFARLERSKANLEKKKLKKLLMKNRQKQRLLMINQLKNQQKQRLLMINQLKNQQKQRLLMINQLKKKRWG